MCTHDDDGPSGVADDAPPSMTESDKVERCKAAAIRTRARLGYLRRLACDQGKAQDEQRNVRFHG